MWDSQRRPGSRQCRSPSARTANHWQVEVLARAGQGSSTCPSRLAGHPGPVRTRTWALARAACRRRAGVTLPGRPPWWHRWPRTPQQHDLAGCPNLGNGPPPSPASLWCRSSQVSPALGRRGRREQRPSCDVGLQQVASTASLSRSSVDLAEPSLRIVNDAARLISPEVVNHDRHRAERGLLVAPDSSGL